MDTTSEQISDQSFEQKFEHKATTEYTQEVWNTVQTYRAIEDIDGEVQKAHKDNHKTGW
jgi:hypothetical protein